MDTTLVLPKRSRGRQSAAAKEAYTRQLEEFASYILTESAKIDFRPSSRGWAYLLEGARLIDKSEIDTAQNTVNELRRNGMLPLDICAEDAKRTWQSIEELDAADPNAEIDRYFGTIEDWLDTYNPRSFWDNQEYYIQMVVEKIDLRELFAPICRYYHIPIANGGGWSDINLRGQMMQRFKEHEAAGRKPVLLYAGDFDPAGLLISDTVLENMWDLAEAVQWIPENVRVDRFGLNYDFIVANNLTWIDNLQTSSGGDLSDPRHPHHKYPHVANYLHQYGAKKCEANALVTRAEQGRDLCRAAIQQYIDPDAPRAYEDSLQDARMELRRQFKKRIRKYVRD